MMLEIKTHSMKFNLAGLDTAIGAAKRRSIDLSQEDLVEVLFSYLSATNSVIVPVKISADMEIAGGDTLANKIEHYGTACDIYRTMIEAAQKP